MDAAIETIVIGELIVEIFDYGDTYEAISYYNGNMVRERSDNRNEAVFLTLKRMSEYINGAFPVDTSVH
ncbi:hypothetical protein CEF21_15090 [Bacillus sp. FJAT-42376]|uniref:hypothetical protein n=1 Tax=Bacillus sp. FJAT-42376 TaxID=2014076 RepID=UPI000F4FA109|nr:hypothetical protein [Bacillus sp. FJAT-42376]AZB43521.1 hypothetical protein CEF21_15090 [Bacillus sp. FJAT-42376]